MTVGRGEEEKRGRNPERYNVKRLTLPLTHEYFGTVSVTQNPKLTSTVTGEPP